MYSLKRPYALFSSSVAVLGTSSGQYETGILCKRLTESVLSGEICKEGVVKKAEWRKKQIQEKSTWSLGSSGAYCSMALPHRGDRVVLTHHVSHCTLGQGWTSQVSLGEAPPISHRQYLDENCRWESLTINTHSSRGWVHPPRKRSLEREPTFTTE